MKDRKTIGLVLLLWAFASAQSLRASPPIGAVVEASHFDADRNQLVVRVANTSQKSITAIALTVFITHSTGGEVSFGYGNDFIWGIIASSELGHEVEPGASHGFGARTSRELTIPLSPPGVSYRATVDVVVYSDGTADVVDRAALKRIVMGRKGWLAGMQKANELLTKALADPNDAQPGVTVEAELRALAHTLEADQHKNMDDPASYEGPALLDAAQNIGNIPKDPKGRSAGEDDHLRMLMKTHDNRKTLLSPHAAVVEGVRP